MCIASRPSWSAPSLQPSRSAPSRSASRYRLGGYAWMDAAPCFADRCCFWWACGDGPIPVVLARLCAVTNRRARHRRLLEHADDLDSHRSATGNAIARDGDRDHVHRHWSGRCGDDRHPIGTSWTSGGDPYHGRSRHLRIKPGVAEADQGASQPDSARRHVLSKVAKRQAIITQLVKSEWSCLAPCAPPISKRVEIRSTGDPFGGCPKLPMAIC